MEAQCAPRSVPASACSDVLLKVAATRSERQAAFELVYRSYQRAGLCGRNERELRFTPYQLLETTDVIITQLRGEVIGTLSLVRDGALGLPMEEIYPDEVAMRRANGVAVAEVSCLADRRRDEARFFGLFRDMTRLMAQLGAKLGVEELLVAVHPRHAPLYRRYMAFEPFGGRRDYPTVNGNPAVALCLNFAKAAVETPKRWNEFFGQPLPADVLQPSPISEADRQYFLSLIPGDQNSPCEPFQSALNDTPLVSGVQAHCA